MNFYLSILSFIESASAGYLLILGLIGVIKWSSNKKALFFSLACICSSFAVYSTHQLIAESAILLTWTFMYFYFANHLSTQISASRYSFVFLLPFIWLIVSIVYPEQFNVHFHTVYFIHFVLISLSCLQITYKINSSQFASELRLKKYFRWLHFGLLVLISIRLVSPLIIADIQTYVDAFHLLLSAYLIGTSGFQLAASYTNFSRSIEETTNLEDMTKRKLDAILKGEKMYLIADLSINELAAKMQMKASDLSSFFNMKLGMNFNDVVNQHRIDEVKRLIVDPTTDPKSTIMELAYKSGFNSKATFNRIFKQITGDTPKEYRKNMAK